MNYQEKEPKYIKIAFLGTIIFQNIISKENLDFVGIM
jgi:hypothetical protein